MNTYYALKLGDNVKVVMPWTNKQGEPTIADFVRLLQRTHDEPQYVSQ